MLPPRTHAADGAGPSDSEQPASPMARMWVRRGPEDVDFVVHILLAIGDSPGEGGGGSSLDVAALKQLLRDRVAPLPRFSEIMVSRRRGWGHEYAWAPVAVDVAEHVREVDLGAAPSSPMDGDKEGGASASSREAWDCGPGSAPPAGAAAGAAAGDAAGVRGIQHGLHALAHQTIQDCVTSYVEEQAMVPLRRDRPLWEVHVISHAPLPVPGPQAQDPGPGTCLRAGSGTYRQSVLWRIHHALGDGVALATLMTRLTTTAAGGPPDLLPCFLSDSVLRKLNLGAVRQKPASTAGTTRSGVRRFAALLGQLGSILAYVLNSLWCLVRLSLLLLSAPDPTGGVKPPLGPAALLRPRRREIARIAIPLAEAKAVARACDATVNDVLLCVVSAAVHWARWLQMCSSEEEDHCRPCVERPPRALVMASVRPFPPEVVRRIMRNGGGSSGSASAGEEEELPVPMGTRVGFLTVDLPPVSMPPPSAAQAQCLAGQPPHSPTPAQSVVGQAAVGNGLHRPLNGALAPQWPGTGHQGDPSSCKRGLLSAALTRLQGQTRGLKNSVEAWLVYNILALTCNLFGPEAMMALVLYAVGKITTGVSNVPGPREVLHLAGSPVVGADQFMAGAPAGLSVHAVSYAGRLHVSVTSLPETARASFMARLMLLAWEELQHDCLPSAGTRGTR